LSLLWGDRRGQRIDHGCLARVARAKSRGAERCDDSDLLGVPEVVHVFQQFRLGDSKLIIQEEQELLLHEIDFGERKVSAVLLPMHVLWGRVVEVFGSTDEDGKEYSMTGALHA